MTRLTKQVVYGGFYACLWAAIFYGAYAVFVKPAPGCFDNIKNRDESEVDCGGAYCVSCEIKNLTPIQVLPVQVVAGADPARATVVIELRNINSNYGISDYAYTLTVFGADPSAPIYSEHITTPLYPAEVKYRVVGGINSPAGSITKAEITVDPIQFAWVASSQFGKPSLPLREIRSQTGTDRITVTGFVKNDNAYVLRRANVNVLFESGGKIISASKTTVNDMLAFEERSFQVVVPLVPELQNQSLTPRVIIDGER